MKKLLAEIRKCQVCAEHLPFAPRPVLVADKDSKIVIIGQAPGTRVQKSGVPWDDQSGDLLRDWMGVDKETFYNAAKIALIPMGFCYPGKGKSGDLPPRPECGPLWHEPLLGKMEKVKLVILIGQYSQKYYLRESFGKNLTETVINFRNFLPAFLPLPHPSPRNRFWLSKNPWFQKELVPVLKRTVRTCLH